MTIATLPIQAVAAINPPQPRDLSNDLQRQVGFVPMANVGEDGTLRSIETRSVGELLAGYTYFADGDVIVAKITPCLQNGKAALVSGLPGGHGFGSTEFHVLRAGPKLDKRYLFYMVWSPDFRRFGEQRFTGSAGQKRMPATAVAEFGIPIPFPDDPRRSLAEQKRIAAILDKADAIRRRRQEAARLADTLIPNLYFELFGDPLGNNREWPTAKVETLCDLVRGSSPRPRSDPSYYGGPVPRLMIEDITRDGKYVTPRIDTLTELGATMSRPVDAGTVVMAVSGNVGLVARVLVDACIHDGFVGFKDLDTKAVRADYFMWTLDLLKASHSKRKAGAIWQNLTTHQVKAMEVPLPPPTLQDRFEKLSKRLVQFSRSYTTRVDEVDGLFNSLVQRAFRGEL